MPPAAPNVIDCKALADSIKSELAKQVAGLVERGVVPGFAIILATSMALAMMVLLPFLPWRTVRIRIGFIYCRLFPHLLCRVADGHENAVAVDHELSSYNE